MSTETELLARIKNDDEKALKDLFETWHNPLCIIAFRIVKDKDLAKDVVQDVFIKFWKKRKQIEITSSFGAYMKRATINTALNQIETSINFKKQEIEKSDLTFYTGNRTDQLLDHEELKRKSDDAILNLPVRTRTVFTLIRMEEMSYKEVSSTLGISLKAVEKEMMKALKLLREALKDYLYLLILFVSGIL
jgi:RNA polymerase sigma-70 factor (ECF subfamily)